MKQRLDPERCQEVVMHDWTSNQCQRKAAVDGKWCRQHDPEAIAKRRQEQSDKWTASRKADKQRSLLPGLRAALELNEKRTLGSPALVLYIQAQIKAIEEELKAHKQGR